MPKDWVWSGDVFARLEAAKIEWETLLPPHPALRESKSALSVATI